ncbi:Prolactin-releasing peptide receptor [Strongyloides ratti]|uniref:Prolactin-releasing peptide receptor n=1 Tax=Strongyloides ratti TaxID=34506 RepID=A0A090KW86_STRRB|nr:Prolactin-releasing peptide receptor [Strongyloides ratti]CEF60131.1 Prolactin-releasing peptide receptor [Strongyloides ratti]
MNEGEELSTQSSETFYADNVTAYMNATNCRGFPKGFSDILMVRVIYLFIYLLIFIVAVTGNSLVVYVVMTKKSMQTVTNIFITNLAISDLLVNFTSLWLTPLYTFLGRWIWGGWLCYGLPLFQGTSIFISTLTLMAIALDRYFVICRHGAVKINANDHISMHMCIGIITVIWAFSLLLVMPYALHMRLTYIKKPCEFWVCLEAWAMEDLKSAYGLIVMILQFIVPFIIIGQSYIKIWKFLNNRKSLVTERESEIETQRKKHLLRMLIIMVVVFAIYDGIKQYFPPLFLTSHVLSMTATCWNPIVYAWMNESFRKEFIHAIPFLQKHFQLNAKNNHRARVITDCQPALIRVNCKDNNKQKLRKIDILSNYASNNDLSEESNANNLRSSNCNLCISNNSITTKKNSNTDIVRLDNISDTINCNDIKKNNVSNKLYQNGYQENVPESIPLILEDIIIRTKAEVYTTKND